MNSCHVVGQRSDCFLAVPLVYLNAINSKNSKPRSGQRGGLGGNDVAHDRKIAIAQFRLIREKGENIYAPKDAPSRAHAAARSHGTTSTPGASKGATRSLSRLYTRSSSFSRPLSHLLTERSTCFAEKSSLSEVKTGRIRRHDGSILDAYRSSRPRTARFRPLGAENDLAWGHRKKISRPCRHSSP